ncbi:MAG: LTA synthase family protein [Lachnospiraceae bacterium]|nr:LTA synthase family protein [Lachnospiraceae bacterium]
MSKIIRRDALRQHRGWLIKTAVLLVYPFLCFYISELAMEFGKDVLPYGVYVHLFNYLWYLLPELALLALTRSAWPAITGLTIWTVLFSTVNIFLMQFRSIPLYMTDLVVAGTAMNVAGEYSYKPTRGIWILAAFLVAGCLLGWFCRRKQKRPIRWLSYLLGVAVSFAAIGGLYGYTLFSPRMAQRVPLSNGFNPTSRYIKHGGMLSFMRSGAFFHTRAPEGYDEDAVRALTEELAVEYGAGDLTAQMDTAAAPAVSAAKADSAENGAVEAGKENGEASAAAAEMPGWEDINLIVIMDETFADLQQTCDFETNEDVMPFYHSLTENTRKGLMVTSVFGGETANSEYEFLTGDSIAFLPSRSSPFQTFIKYPMDSFSLGMEELGYAGRIAMHPYLRKGYNRETAYSNLGFTSFISVEDLPKDIAKIRNRVTDEADVDWMIETFDELIREHEEPVFLYNVTMQNHGPHDVPWDDVPDTIRITSEGVADQATVEQYLNLVHLSDAALEKLIRYCETLEEPTVVVFFGDHLPSITPEFYQSVTGADKDTAKGSDILNYYRVPYLIWSNFESESQTVDDMSINYLHTVVQERFNLPMSGYDRYVNRLMEAYPVLSAHGVIDAAGQYYAPDDEELLSQELYQQYSYLSFYHLFDSQEGEAFYCVGR